MPYDIEYLTNLSQIASAVVAIVALFFSGISIYLTKKSIESANRPDIIPYVATLEIHETAYYFVLKNFGASSTKLLKFSTDFDWSTITLDGVPDVFTKVEGVVFPPGYKMIARLDETKVKTFIATSYHNHKEPEIEIKLKYRGSRFRAYRETISVHFGAFVSTPCVRVMPDENTFDAKAYLVNGLIEFEERLL